MERRGLYISGGAHAALLIWMLAGGIFSSEPPDVVIADVTVISEAEFAALTAEPEPVPAPQAPEQPAPPVEDAPEPVPEPAPEPAPAPQPAPPQPAPPEPPAPEPAPEPEVTPPPAPPPAPETPPQPEAPPVEAVPVPNAPVASLRPKPRPAPRVAPEPVAPPEPDTAVAEEVQQAADPDAESPDQVDEAQEATAPEETATEIVTEAEEPASAPAAPTRSLRPQVRPQRVAAAPAAPQDATDNAAPDTSNAINAALADLLGGDPAPAPSGAPLTRGEREGLRLAVQACWVVDVGSQSANVTVVVGFALDRDGRVSGDVRLVSASGGDGGAVDVAFRKARTAVLRCQREGYDLPEDKYEQWQNVEMTFNPADMRLR